MTMKTLNDIAGFEYDWLVCDESGQVALFSTAGAGYAPNVFLADTEAYYQAIDGILKLPVMTAAKIFPKIGEGLENTWKQASERGVYGYDADFNGGDYTLVSAPSQPVFVDRLPVEISDVVNRFKIKGIFFGTTDSVTKSEISLSEN